MTATDLAEADSTCGAQPKLASAASANAATSRGVARRLLRLRRKLGILVRSVVVLVRTRAGPRSDAACACSQSSLRDSRRPAELMRRERLPVDREIVELAIGFAYQALKGGRVVGVLPADERDDATLLNRV